MLVFVRLQTVLCHSFHILLDDGFQLSFHRFLLVYPPHKVMFHQRVRKGIDGFRMLTIELQHIVVFHVLIDAVQIVDGPCFFRRGVQQVNAKGEVGFGIVQHAHQRWQDIYLLGYLVLYLRLTSRLIYYNR